MTAATASPLPVGGSSRAFSGAIPGGSATTEGVDYWISLVDGLATDTTTTHHVTVLAPTSIAHVPVVTALPAQPIPVDAVVPCATPTCSVTLSYRVTGDGVGAAPPFSALPMAAVGAPTAVGAATTLQRYGAFIPAEAVTTKGVDYFIAANDGHTNAYSPGTAYAATAFTRTDGTGAAYFNVHVAEAVHIVHAPVAVAPYHEPIHIEATVNCATRSCAATLGYRRSAGLTSAAGVAAYLRGEAAFTSVSMASTVIHDAGPAGTVVRYDADIPAQSATTDGVDYSLRVTDGLTTAYWPGTSYVAGIGGSVDGRALAWQHVEVLGRQPVMTISHAPVPAVPFRTAVPLRFSAACTADRPCTPTAWYRTTPNTGGLDTSQLRGAEPEWPTTPVRTLSVQPNGSGFLLYVFEADIPEAAVDTRGADYLLKVADGERAAYWPAAPFASASELAAPPLLAQHVSTLSSPVILHTPTAAVTAGNPVTLAWRVVCAVDEVSECRTEAYHRHVDDPAAGGAAIDIAGSSLVLNTPVPFAPLPTTTHVVASTNGYLVLEAQAVFAASATPESFEQYFLWAADAHTNAYSPGTTYQGAVVPLDGTNLGPLAPWTALVTP